MSRRNNLIYIQTTNTNNYSSAGNSYTLDQLWQIKERVELDRTLSNISPERVNLIRKLRIQKRRNRGRGEELKCTMQYYQGKDQLTLTILFNANQTV